jgi:phosphoserine phosphatase RsbU/P
LTVNYYLILPVLAFLINFFIMAYASALNIKNPLNRSYVMLSASISIWVLCSAAFHLPLDDSVIVPFSRFSSFFWFSTGFLFTNFTYVFLRRRRDLFYYASLGMSLLAFAVAVKTELIVSGFSRYHWGWRFNEGVLFNAASQMAIVIPIVVSWVLAFRERQSTRNQVRRKQITPLLAGTFISLMFAGINQFVLPNLRGFENIVRYTASWSVIMSIFVFYTIIRHHFLTPRIKDMAVEFFANSFEGVVILNDTGMVLNINSSALKILNTGDGEPALLRIEDFIKGYRADMNYNNYQTTTAGQEAKRTILVNQSEMRAGNMTIGRILIINDITEMARMNEALRESNELFKLISSNVTDVIWIFDLATFKFSYVSPSVTASTGWSPDDFSNFQLSDLLNEDDLNGIIKALNEEIGIDGTRDPGRSRSYMMKERSRSGAMIDVEIRASFIRDAAGKPVAILGVTRDITEQKRLEDELRLSLSQLKERNDTIENDLKTAQKIQRALLPAKAPACERLAIEFRYHPLEAVGGDFFNIQPLAEGGLSIFLSDVTGHGITAALFLSLLKLTSNVHMRRYAYEPSAFMAALNADLFENLQSYYVTAVYGVFKFSAGEKSVRLSTSCGGHPPPIVHRAGEGSAFYFDVHGKIIGLLDDLIFQSRDITLQPGDRIYFYTDGLPEIADTAHEYLGFDRFLDIVSRTGGLGLGEALDAVMSAANDFRGAEPIADDILLIGVEVL